MRSARPACANAARWLHLIAATVAVVVDGAALAARLHARGCVERHRSTRASTWRSRPVSPARAARISWRPARSSVVIPTAIAPARRAIDRTRGRSSVARSAAARQWSSRRRSRMAARTHCRPLRCRTTRARRVALFNASRDARARSARRVRRTLARTAAGPSRCSRSSTKSPRVARWSAGAARALEERRKLWRALFAEDAQRAQVFVDLAASRPRGGRGGDRSARSPAYTRERPSRPRSRCR